MVECLVEHVLLVLAIDTVLFRDLVLVSHLYAQNALKQADLSTLFCGFNPKRVFNGLSVSRGL